MEWGRSRLLLSPSQSASEVPTVLSLFIDAFLESTSRMQTTLEGSQKKADIEKRGNYNIKGEKKNSIDSFPTCHRHSPLALRGGRKKIKRQHSKTFSGVAAFAHASLMEFWCFSYARKSWKKAARRDWLTIFISLRQELNSWTALTEWKVIAAASMPCVT